MRDEGGGCNLNGRVGRAPAEGDARTLSLPTHPSSLSLIFVALWLLLLLAGRSAMLHDPGSFWHVVAGQRMLATGQVLREDPFSFTFAGRPWVADQWLAECGMAAVHRLAGSSAARRH